MRSTARNSTTMHPMTLASRLLRCSSRSSRDFFPFEARRDRSFLPGRSFPLNLLAPSSLAASSTSHLFCLHHNQINPWQLALDNKFISAPRPHPNFPSLINNFHTSMSPFLLLILTLLSPSLIISFATSPGTQAGAALFSASAFAHRKTTSFGDRAGMLASRTPYRTHLQKTVRSHSFRNTKPKPLTA